jgi:hypothetical protein
MDGPDTLLSSALDVAASNLRTWSLALPALRELNRLEIPYIVYKSLPQVEDLYGHAGGRLTTDVDVIVHRSDVTLAIDSLGCLGWLPANPRMYVWLQENPLSRPASSSRAWTLIRRSDMQPCLIDMHPDATARGSHPSFTPEIWSRTTTVQRDDVTFQVISPEDRLIFLCWHVVTHGMRAHWLKDIEIILLKDEPLDWEYVAASSAGAGTAGMVKFVCDLVSKRLNHSFGGELPAMTPHQRLFAALYGQHMRPLTRVPTIVFRMVMLDHAFDVTRQARDVFLPAKLDIATNYLYRWPDSREYIATLLKIYTKRIQKRLSILERE